MNKRAALCHLLLHPVISPEQQESHSECRSKAKVKREQWQRLSHRIAHADRLIVQSLLTGECLVQVIAQLRQWRVRERANVHNSQRLNTMLSL